MTEKLSIRRDAFDFLLNIVEHPRSKISGAVLHSDYPHLVVPLVDGGWLVPSGDPLNLTVDGEDTVPFYELEWDPERKKYRYLAGSLGWVYVEPARLKSYVVDIERLLALLSQHLDIPGSHRTTCLHEGLLWHLGPGRLAGARAHMYLARGLGEPRNREPFRRAMTLERGKKPAVVLHAGRTAPTWLDSPLDEHVVPIRHLFGRRDDTFSLDHDVIRAILGYGPDPARQEVAVLRFSTGYRSVEWHGMNYRLTKTQAALVECLDNEGGRAHGTVLSAAANTDQSVQQIMRNRVDGKWITHPLFGTLIRGEGNGYFVLDREAAPPEN